MAIELVTGHSGAAHVSGADAGAMHAGICGSDSYVLGAVPSVTMSDANTLTIQPCDLMVEGRHVRLSGTNTISIRSGAQTGKRNDLVYVRYTYDSSTGVESAKLGVKEGTTATTATDPALDNPSSVLDGATIADVAVCRVSLDALTPTATWLLPQLPTLAALGDSVSHVAEPLVFHQVESGASAWGCVVGGIAVIVISWTANRSFTSGTWGETKLVTFDGWTCNSQVHAPFVDNYTADGAGAGLIDIYSNNLYFRTKKAVTVSKGQWHTGFVCVPVTRA